jgi:hypothetical protein
LQQTEADADASLKSAAAASRSLKRLRAVVHDGNLRELRSDLAAAEQTVEALQEQVAMTVQGWDFDEARYLSSGAFVDELLVTARRMQVAIYEQDDRLYCYPSLVRVLATERTILIDRARERRLRPSVVAPICARCRIDRLGSNQKLSWSRCSRPTARSDSATRRANCKEAPSNGWHACMSY